MRAICEIICYFCGMNFKILTSQFVERYAELLQESPCETLEKTEKTDVDVDYFKFYASVSSVYSSKTEGEDIDFDSFFKHKFLNVKFKPDYTRRADDLFSAYEFIENRGINLANLQKAHAVLSAHLLPKSQQGRIRTNPMFVINSDDRIEYVAAEPAIVQRETEKLFHDIRILQETELNDYEIFYYAALIHLVFVKIHPFQDGNGRAARLLEKWFLLEKLGKKALAVPLEKNYFTHLTDYYANIRKLGLEYDELDYAKSLDFLLMTAKGISALSPSRPLSKSPKPPSQ